MTTVSIDNGDNLLTIIINGHAGYADIGYDIVCSAISAITYALINTLDAHNADIEVTGGYCLIQARYSDEAADYVQGVVDVATNGYMAIADKYPDYLDYCPC